MKKHEAEMLARLVLCSPLELRTERLEKVEIKDKIHTEWAQEKGGSEQSPNLKTLSNKRKVKHDELRIENLSLDQDGRPKH